MKFKLISKNALIAFGLFDLYTFFRTYRLGLEMWNTIEYTPILNVLTILLITSLIASGILSILGKKSSLIIYYVQFPFRLLFMILTFGFLLKIFDLQFNTTAYKVVVGLVFLLELFRVVSSILIHRREFSKPVHINL